MQSAIANAIDASGTATVLVHSTGGLVFRAFIESHPAYAAKIDRVLAFAVPWVGTMYAFEALSRGVSEKFLGILGFGADEVQRLTSKCQAAYDLCPPDPAETDMTDVDGNPIQFFKTNGVVAGPLVMPSDWTSDPTAQQLASNARARFGSRSRSIANVPALINICGWGASTVHSCALANGQLSFADAKSGDGTVPFESASWINAAQTFYVPVGAYERNAIPETHPHIWDSPPVTQLLGQILGTAAAKPFIAAAVDGDDNFPSVDPVRIRVAACSATGQVLPNLRVSLFGTTYPLKRRLEIKLARAGLPNNANGNARLELQFDWTGGSAKTAIAIRVV